MVFECMYAVFDSQIPNFRVRIERATCNDIITSFIGIEGTYLNGVTLKAISDCLYVHFLLLSVFKSHTFIEPLLDPTIT